MRSTLVVAVFVVGVGGVARADEPPLYACHAPAADSKISVQFKPDASIRDVVTWALGFTCKNIVLSAEAERAAPRVTILAPKPMTPKQALALFVDTLETAGLVVTVKADSILIKPGPSLPQHCPDVSTASPSPGGELSPYPGADSEDPHQKLIDSGVKVIDPTHYEVTKALWDAVLDDPAPFDRGFRAVPNAMNGKITGLKLFSVRPGSVFAKLGFANGDVVERINGDVLDPPEKMLELHAKLRGARKVEVELVRRGKPLTLTYTVKN